MRCVSVPFHVSLSLTDHQETAELENAGARARARGMANHIRAQNAQQRPPRIEFSLSSPSNSSSPPLSLSPPGSPPDVQPQPGPQRLFRPSGAHHQALNQFVSVLNQTQDLRAHDTNSILDGLADRLEKSVEIQSETRDLLREVSSALTRQAAATEELVKQKVSRPRSTSLSFSHPRSSTPPPQPTSTPTSPQKRVVRRGRGRVPTTVNENVAPS